MEKNWYEKFRWFFTSSGLLVIGGKSAEQNEEVVRNRIENNDLVLHTATPGSPFAVIKSEKCKITTQDVKEAAIFCASFSQQWKKGKRTAEIHVFSPNQIKKERGEKEGTFSVAGKIEKINAELRLFIDIQEGKIRAVPENAAKKKDIEITPGKMSKEEASKKIREILKENKIDFSEIQIMQALPAGSFKIIK
ncbi:MAG: NFACT RNA binding domain-containing protein [archaeon]